MRLTLVALVVFAPAAHADTPVTRPTAIEVDREAPPPGRAEFGFDGGAPVGAWAASVQLGYVDEPIQLGTPSLTIIPVRRRETVALGGAITLGDRLVADARMPLAHQVGDRLIGLGDDTPLDRWVAGDLALGARIRITETDTVQTFARFAFTIPTGDDDNFAGEAKWTYSSSLIGRLTFGRVVVAANAGILIRDAEVQVGDRVVGDELLGGFGTAVALPPIAGLWCERNPLRVTAELAGELADHSSGVRGASPAEARLGFVGHPILGLALSVRAGLGLDDQIGSPRFRAMVELAWQAPEPPRARPPAAVEDDEDDQ
ncbi:MAG TPA: hypothetical protein VMJ10_24565 [Kofleriaceae bacterium]|nr:hypothetical protein [Kofleriaceae bacterium]